LTLKKEVATKPSELRVVAYSVHPHASYERFTARKDPLPKAPNGFDGRTSAHEVPARLNSVVFQPPRNSLSHVPMKKLMAGPTPFAPHENPPQPMALAPRLSLLTMKATPSPLRKVDTGWTRKTKLAFHEKNVETLWGAHTTDA
jgi:hypothetical protein